MSASEEEILSVSGSIMLLLHVMFPEVSTENLGEGMLKAMNEIANGRMCFDEIHTRARVNNEGHIYFHFDESVNDPYNGGYIVKHIC